MSVILGFDVYGTLIDTAGITASLKQFAGSGASDFSSTWREKQLEYSFRRGLMQKYQNFSVCTRDALEYTCKQLDIQIAQQDKDKLMSAYQRLPPFPDVVESLPKLQQSFSLFAFSNGRAEDIESLLINGEIRPYFKDIISTDEIKSFKPDPAVYNHFLSRAKTSSNEAWLISGNPFDVIGALSVGMKGAWVKRLETALFDPWGIEPTVTISSLSELADAIYSSD